MIKIFNNEGSDNKWRVVTHTSGSSKISKVLSRNNGRTMEICAYLRCTDVSLFTEADGVLSYAGDTEIKYQPKDLSVKIVGAEREPDNIQHYYRNVIIGSVVIGTESVIYRVMTKGFKFLETYIYNGQFHFIASIDVDGFANIFVNENGATSKVEIKFDGIKTLAHINEKDDINKKCQVRKYRPNVPTKFLVVSKEEASLVNDVIRKPENFVITVLDDDNYEDMLKIAKSERYSAVTLLTDVARNPLTEKLKKNFRIVAIYGTDLAFKLAKI